MSLPTEVIQCGLQFRITSGYISRRITAEYAMPTHAEPNERDQVTQKGSHYSYKGHDALHNAHMVKKVIRFEISTAYHLLSVSQCLCVLPQMKLRIG